MRAEPEGKQQHVVETLNVLDTGTSVLLEAAVRPDFVAETALQAVAQTLQTRGVPQQNAFVERSHRTYQEECLAIDRPATLEQAREVTTAFVEHYNYERPNQALSCGNQPPRPAFASLPSLPALPQTVDPDGWLQSLDGLHLSRKVNRDGFLTIDLKPYYVSRRLAGQRVSARLDAADRCLQIFQEHHLLKSVPLKGLVGQQLSFEQFLAHMQTQARAQRRLRSLQERRQRTAAFASP